LVLDLVIHSGDDGFSAEIPSIKGCESWAHTEEEVIEKIVELVRYYLKLGPAHIIDVDYGRRSKNKKVLKLLIRKD